MYMCEWLPWDIIWLLWEDMVTMEHDMVAMGLYISLSTVVLNSRDWLEIIWLPENFAL